METKSLDSSKQRRFRPRGTIEFFRCENGRSQNPEILSLLLLGVETYNPWRSSTHDALSEGVNCMVKSVDENVCVLEIRYTFSHLHSGQIVAFGNHIDKLATVLAKLNLDGIGHVRGSASFEIVFDCHYFAEAEKPEGLPCSIEGGLNNVERTTSA